MVWSRLSARLVLGVLAALCVAFNTPTGGAVLAAENGQSRTAGGLTAYLGIVPAEIVKGPSPHSPERPMHGRIPKGPHEYHIVVALFAAASGARVSDAAVTAQVSGLALSGASKKLEPMEIGGTTTYGAFVDLPGRDLYTVKLTVRRAGGGAPVVLPFKYEHRRQ